VKKTTTLLADGRELHYFDSDDAPARVAEDERVLPAQAAVSEIRRDALTDEWVVVASHRQDRTHLPAAVDCPLCPTRDGHRTEIPDDDYEVVVFTNRFPSLSTTPAREPLPQTPWSERRPGDGRCEVVCFTPDHDGAFSRLAPDRLRTVVEVWVDRTCELSALPEVEEVFVFENRGVEIGVTLHHPHGQIYGYPFVTPRTAQLQASAARYAERHDGACVACDVLAEEGAGPRGSPVPRVGSPTCPWRRDGPSRCTSFRCATSTTCPAWTRRSGASWDPCRPTSWPGSMRSSASRCRTWPAGSRPRCAPDASCPTCDWRSSRAVGRRRS